MNRIIILLILISSVAKSQCLSGTYTIGGTGPDYIDFSTAVNAITTNGICGNVIFNVRPGTYNEAVTIPYWATTPTKTVTFKAENGDSSSVILTYDSLYTLKIVSAYINVEHISITSSGDGSILIDQTSNHINVLNCKITPVGSVPYYYACFINRASNIMLSTNYITSSYEGITTYGTTGLLVQNIEIINNQISAPSANGIFASYADDIIISGNVVNSYFGISVDQSTGNISVFNNKVRTTNQGISISNGISPVKAEIYNNFINAGPGSFFDGLDAGDIDTAFIYHNTVRVSSSSLTDVAVLISFTGYFYLRNNIFMNANTGGVFWLQHASGGTYDLDHNMYYTNGADIGYDPSMGGTISTLAAYTGLTGLELTGKQVNPMLVSPIDLHLTALSPARDSAIVLPITTDIDGQPRELLPDIGADEYVSLIGIEETQPQNGGIHIFPNPTSDKVVLVNTNVHTVAVFSIDGSFLGNYAVLNQTIDLSSLAPGVYFLSCGYQTVKCIKQ